MTEKAGVSKAGKSDGKDGDEKGIKLKSLPPAGCFMLPEQVIFASIVMVFL